MTSENNPKLESDFESIWNKPLIKNPFKDEIGNGLYSCASIGVRNRKMAAKFMYIEGRNKSLLDNKNELPIVLEKMKYLEHCLAKRTESFGSIRSDKMNHNVQEAYDIVLGFLKGLK